MPPPILSLVIHSSLFFSTHRPLITSRKTFRLSPIFSCHSVLPVSPTPSCRHQPLHLNKKPTLRMNRAKHSHAHYSNVRNSSKQTMRHAVRNQTRTRSSASLSSSSDEQSWKASQRVQHGQLTAKRMPILLMMIPRMPAAHDLRRRHRTTPQRNDGASGTTEPHAT